jgi:hypothetical protein
LLRATQVCYADPAMASPERLLLPDAKLSRPALVLAQRFVRRWDLHARQLDDGSYICVHEQLNMGHLFAHLRGEITLGAYLLDQESRARFLALDADDAQLSLARQIKTSLSLGYCRGRCTMHFFCSFSQVPIISPS